MAVEQLSEYEWRLLIDDFSGGMMLAGPDDTTYSKATDKTPESYFPRVKNMRSESGLGEPINVDSSFGVSFSSGAVADLIFGYQHSITQVMVLSNGKLQHMNSGATVAVTSVTAIGSFGDRQAAQLMGYMVVGGATSASTAFQTPQTLYCYNLNGPGAGKTSGGTFTSGAQMGIAGTPCPTFGPTPTIRTAASSLTTGTLYRYRLGWKYGTGGELGLGWRESHVSVSITGITQAISVTMNTDPPSEYAHCVKRSLYRNTDAFPDSFFLVTETDYSSSMVTSILDTASDASIELGEECDPIDPKAGLGTLASQYRSEMLPPKAVYVCAHEDRLWFGDITVSDGTRYPCRIAFSRIDGANGAVVRRVTQVDPNEFVELPAGYGRMTGLFEWMGNLYATFERAIFVQSFDPGPGRLPAFTLVVAGFGCISPKSIAPSPFGVFMNSSQGPILFDGGPRPQRVGDRIRAILGSSAIVDGCGKYDPKRHSYVVGFPTVGSAYEFLPEQNGGRGYWHEVDGGVSSGGLWANAETIGDSIYYSLTTGANKEKLLKRGSGALGGGSSSPVTRVVTTKFHDFGRPNEVKTLRKLFLQFATSVTVGELSGNADSVSLYLDGDANAVASAFSLATNSGMEHAIYFPSTVSFRTMKFDLNLNSGGSRLGVLKQLSAFAYSDSRVQEDSKIGTIAT